MLSPGVVLSNRYLLNERIAAGGMGEVWRGTTTTTPAYATGRAESHGNPYYGGPTGPTGPVPQPATPAATPPGNGRRNATVAALAAAVLVGVIGLVVAIALHPGASEAQTQPPGGVGDGPGGFSRDLPGRGNGNGRQGQPGGAPASQTPRSGPSRDRTRTSAPTTAPTGSTGPATTNPTTGATTSPATGGGTTNPYGPKDVCGAGFAVIDSQVLRSSSAAVGKVYLLYNSASGKNCTATLKSVDVGVATAASAYLEVQGGARTTDGGSFKFYAGPVKVAAKSTCVKWGGSVGGASYDSPFGHCD